MIDISACLVLESIQLLSVLVTWLFLSMTMHSNKSRLFYFSYLLSLTPLLAVSYILLYTKSLQYSCLENPMDRGAWQATVQGVTKSWTRMKWVSMHYAKLHDPLSSVFKRPWQYTWLMTAKINFPYSILATNWWPNCEEFVGQEETPFFLLKSLDFIH